MEMPSFSLLHQGVCSIRQAELIVPFASIDKLLRSESSARRRFQALKAVKASHLWGIDPVGTGFDRDLCPC